MGWVREGWRFFCNKMNGVGDWFWSHWDRCTIRTMDTTLQAIFVVSVILFLLIGVSMTVGTFAAPLSLFTVWAGYTFNNIAIPCVFVALISMWIESYLTRLRRRGVQEFWDSDRASNFGKTLLHVNWGLNVAWILAMLFIISTGHADAIYVPELHVTVKAISALIVGELLIPMCLFMVGTSVGSLFFSKLSLRILRDEIERLRRRESRDSGWSLPDSANDDDIFEAKLERLGIG